MKHKKTIAVVTLLGIILFLINCRKDVKLPDPEPPLYGIAFNVPQGWPAPVYNFENNNLTEEGFRLGRRLFYEEKLSRDNSISCATCHQQFVAFAHSAHDISHGVDGLVGNRNTPGLFNLNWVPNFMWDGGINHIEIQPLGPIKNPVEMDEDINNVIVKLEGDPSYKQMFKDAFGDQTVNSQRMLKAFAQFMGMMNSSNSKYDKVTRGEAGVVFTAQETSGLNLFRAKCVSCHTEPLFSDYSYRNNGIAVNTAYNDSGRAHITFFSNDLYKFKVPSLRNIALTAPYMHDGRFETLDDCLEHYNSGVNATVNLDPLLTSGIPLNAQEKLDLISFLSTLTDNEFTKDIRFSDPG